ncbi:MAG: DUF4418 family protein [Dehalococcoidaceae bacterium]|nr:DUF4418 family protein [Dehalococcoidaceae bacterium]
MNTGLLRFLGVALVLLAVALAVIPQFTDCQSQGSMITLANGKVIPMKCHWTAMAQIALAVPIVLVGLAMAVRPRKMTSFWLGIFIMVLGLLPILTTTLLIGTCVTPTMYCNVAMKPVIFVLGGLVMLIGLVVTISSLMKSRNKV